MPNKFSPIGLFDSGIGGLTVANAVAYLLPKEHLLYFGDTARAPYGPQSAEQIIAYSFEISQFLVDRGAKIIVAACNTATAAALSKLREAMPEVLFVGMEPAVKPAVEASRSRKIGVLATQGTFSSERYAQLLMRYASDYQVFENPCVGLVPAIEEGKWTDASTANLLEDIIHPMLRKGVDTLVLGCTHYPLVSSLIQKIAGPEINIIDPAPAIARRVKHLLAEKDWLNSSQQISSHRLFASGSTDVMLQIAKRYFGDHFEIENKLSTSSK